MSWSERAKSKNTPPDLNETGRSTIVHSVTGVQIGNIVLQTDAKKETCLNIIHRIIATCGISLPVSVYDNALPMNEAIEALEVDSNFSTQFTVLEEKELSHTNIYLRLYCTHQESGLPITAYMVTRPKVMKTLFDRLSEEETIDLNEIGSVIMLDPHGRGEDSPIKSMMEKSLAYKEGIINATISRSSDAIGNDEELDFVTPTPAE